MTPNGIEINSKMLAQSKLALALNPNMTSEQRERVSDVLESAQELFKQQNREAAAAETSKTIAGSVNGDSTTNTMKANTSASTKSTSNNTENGNVSVSTPSPATSPDPFLALPIQIQSSTLASDSTEPPSTFAVTFPQGLAWGFVGCIGAFGAGENTREVLQSWGVKNVDDLIARGVVKQSAGGK